MTPQNNTIMQDGAPAQLYTETIYTDDDATTALEKILTPEEIATSRLMNVQFFTSKYQVPNEYIEIGKDEKGNPITEPYTDNLNPKFKEYEMVRVTTVDSTSLIPTILVEFVRDYHRIKYADRYQAFKAGQQIGVQGVSIEDLPNISPAAKSALIAGGVLTVEQLAKLSNPGAVVPNGSTYQKIARKFLENQSSDKTSKLEEEAAAMKEELEAMKAQMAELLKAAKK